MNHRNTALTTVGAALIAGLLTGCSADEPATGATRTTASSSPDVPSPETADPVELKGIPAGTALEPAAYALPFIGSDTPWRAVVDVPEGYFSAGGWVIDDGHGTLAPDEYGDLMFIADVDSLSSDPCGGGSPTSAGHSVQDLADVLVAQRRRHTSTPVPVQLDGYDGLYLTSTGSGDPGTCKEHLAVLHGSTDGWLEDDFPGEVDHLWILNVNGRRLVAVARTVPGHTSDPDELVDITRSVRFTFGDES